MTAEQPAPRTAAGRQEAAVAMFRREGFVFDGKGGRWEKCAFTLYNLLVEALLDEEAEAAAGQPPPDEAVRLCEDCGVALSRICWPCFIRRTEAASPPPTAAAPENPVAKGIREIRAAINDRPPAGLLCQSPWHQESHSTHSACPNCNETWAAPERVTPPGIDPATDMRHYPPTAAPPDPHVERFVREDGVGIEVGWQHHPAPLDLDAIWDHVRIEHGCTHNVFERAAPERVSGLDVERLAAAIEDEHRFWLHDENAPAVDDWQRRARTIAAEYARLAQPAARSESSDD